MNIEASSRAQLQSFSVSDVKPDSNNSKVSDIAYNVLHNNLRPYECNGSLK